MIGASRPAGNTWATMKKRRGDGPIRFRTHFRNTIYDVLKERPGWVETDSADDWDFMWDERDVAYEAFDTMHLDAWQRINHFRNGRELCRKDLLAKNIKRHKRQLEKEGKIEEANRFDFTPITFILPGDYALFVEEFKKPQHSGALWIMKPIARSQGKGIFLFNKLQQIQQWKSEYRWKPENNAVEAYVVQKYLATPYLIGGKKFDLRVYALVTCYSPLTVWIYRTGFTRFSASRYSTDSIENAYVHLTNVAVQKTSIDYNPDFGGKWEIGKLKAYLACKHGFDAANTLFADIQGIMLRSLFTVQKAIINDPHCFELYGYDILIDDQLKPWLLEVNASPSMTASTRDDYDLKYKLLNDTLDIVDLEGRFTTSTTSAGGASSSNAAAAGSTAGGSGGSGLLGIPLPTSVGGFDLVWKDGPVGVGATGAMPLNPTSAVVFGQPVPASLKHAAAVALGPAEPAPVSVAGAGAGGGGEASAASDGGSVSSASSSTSSSATSAVPLYGGAGIHGCTNPITPPPPGSSAADGNNNSAAAGSSGNNQQQQGQGAPVIDAVDGCSRAITIHTSLMGALFDPALNVWQLPLALPPPSSSSAPAPAAATSAPMPASASSQQAPPTESPVASSSATKPLIPPSSSSASTSAPSKGGVAASSSGNNSNISFTGNASSGAVKATAGSASSGGNRTGSR